MEQRKLYLRIAGRMRGPYAESEIREILLRNPVPLYELSEDGRNWWDVAQDPDLGSVLRDGMAAREHAFRAEPAPGPNVRPVFEPRGTRSTWYRRPELLIAAGILMVSSIGAVLFFQQEQAAELPADGVSLADATCLVVLVLRTHLDTDEAPRFIALKSGVGVRMEQEGVVITAASLLRVDPYEEALIALVKQHTNRPIKRCCYIYDTKDRDGAEAQISARSSQHDLALLSLGASQEGWEGLRLEAFAELPRGARLRACFLRGPSAESKNFLNATDKTIGDALANAVTPTRWFEKTDCIHEFRERGFAVAESMTYVGPETVPAIPCIGQEVTAVLVSPAHEALPLGTPVADSQGRMVGLRSQWIEDPDGMTAFVAADHIRSFLIENHIR